MAESTLAVAYAHINKIAPLRPLFFTFASFAFPLCI
jgi:hypothetical protein